MSLVVEFTIEPFVEGEPGPHVRAAVEAAEADGVTVDFGPFGTTVAHGYLTLSLLPRLAESALRIDDVRMGVNYGLNRVRFPAPVPAGSRIRARMKLLAYEPIDGGAQLVMEVTMEREGGDKPVCVAETVSRRYL